MSTFPLHPDHPASLTNAAAREMSEDGLAHVHLAMDPPTALLVRSALNLVISNPHVGIEAAPLRIIFQSLDAALAPRFPAFRRMVEMGRAFDALTHEQKAQKFKEWGIEEPVGVQAGKN